MVLVRNKTLAVLLIAIIFTLSFTGTAVAADASGMATPGPDATATPVPAPAQRQVFSAPTWNTDHETIVVKNDGGPIIVVAWINSPSNNYRYEIEAGATKTIVTPSILTQDGQIVDLGFEALENGTTIDTYNATITVHLGPSPTALPAEIVTITGTVADADNGAPVPEATVTFESITHGKKYSALATGSDGAFVSPKMYPDYYKIVVNAAGYKVYRSTTSDKVTGDSSIDIMLTKQAGASTPTPAPPSATPANPIDSWISLLYTPQLCLGALTALVTAIGGSIGIYEWMEKRRKAGKQP